VSGFILDCSLAAAWCFEDEETQEAYALLERAWREPVHVPILWHMEVTNALLQAERRKRIETRRVAIKIEIIATIPVITDYILYLEMEKAGLISLAQRENLTVYDAVYLDLAMRKRLPLATLDKALREAAGRNGIAVLPKKI